MRAAVFKSHESKEYNGNNMRRITSFFKLFPLKGGQKQSYEPNQRIYAII